MLRDLAAAGCGIVTVGQYLPPSRRHPPVTRFVTPEAFAAYAAYGREVGIPQVHSAPLVRSSYHAEAFGPAAIRGAGERGRAGQVGGDHGASR